MSAARAAPPGPVELRVDVRPPWPFRLPGGSMDGLLQRRRHSVQRLLRVDGAPVHVGALQPAEDRVVVAARAPTAAAAREGIARMRFALGVDDDLRPFHEAFRGDLFIGRVLRAHPYLRVRRRPDPWEALLAAVTEQLIAFERAAAIQRRLHAALGYRCRVTALRDAASPAAVAAQAPASLAALDLAPRRAVTLRRCARAVAGGSIDLRDHDVRRLLAIPGIGSWTVEMLGLHGQGRMELVPALDVGYLKLVGRVTTGHPKARADEAEVRGFFARYGAWKGLAGEYLRLADLTHLTPTRRSPGRAPDRAGTRSSAAAAPAAAR